MIAIFSNSPFDDEIRVDCEMIKMNTYKDGEICILPNFNNSIFEICDTVVFCKNNNNVKQIKINGTGIVKFENNTLNCFGSFEEI